MIKSSRSPMKFATTALVALSVALVPAAVLAEEDDPNAAVTAQTERYKAETARIEAETGRINARAARSQARIDALGLPSYEGTAKADAGTGVLEATMLSAATLGHAAQLIGDDLGNETFLVLAGTETVPFDELAAIETEMAAIRIELERGLRLAGAGGRPVAPSSSDTEDVALFTAALSAAAGLLRQNIEVTTLDTKAISARLLATAIARRRPDKVVLPNEAVATSGRVQVLTDFNSLIRMSIEAEQVRAGLNAQNRRHAPAIAALDAALSRYRAFFTRVTTADDDGVVPISQAARVQQLLPANRRILRVHVEHASGSLLNISNITTFFGADPLRVSGGSVISYLIVDPRTGTVAGAGVLTCRSALATLREVQEGRWQARRSSGRPAANGQYCAQAVNRASAS